MAMEKIPNQLINATSPYLLQHAYNPVKWHEWNAESLAKAKDQNKLILVSIGYSACHWCHVMEHESFESQEVAEVMNKHFICIKVDREERPDVDQIYMLAVQIMNGNGGWPLNAICLPDQRPIYGGTYFRKTDWINILNHVAQLWAQTPQKALEYATRLNEAINKAEKMEPIKHLQGPFLPKQIEEIVKPWITQFDITDGGYNRAPKFPLPNNWMFLLRYSVLANNQAVKQHVGQTLEKMAFGGIYDHVGGGFARYSVDAHWHVPHFEKMLYDNAQLIGLYAEAYQYYKHQPFKQIAKACIAWVQNEMTAENGLFFSALDADSEGIEGRFYVWDKNEFDETVGEDAALLAEYFNVTDDGNWEEEQTNVLRRLHQDEDLASKYQITTAQLQDKVSKAKQKLLQKRTNRIKPGLDDKCLTAWNAMMVRSLADASQVFAEPAYYQTAKNTMDFILKNLAQPNGHLYRNYKNGKANIAGFLDDYAFLIDALIALYDADFNEEWLQKAQVFTNFVLQHFSDDETDMFFYTSAAADKLIARKHEIMDNVIPASNSVMALNLQKLALYFDDQSYAAKALAMLNSVLPRMKNYGSGFSNWGIQLLNEVHGINEIAFVGDGQASLKKQLQNVYIPNKIMLGGTKSSLPLLKDKQSNDTKIYICRNKTCQLPIKTVKEAVELINNS